MPEINITAVTTAPPGLLAGVSALVGTELGVPAGSVWVFWHLLIRDNAFAGPWSNSVNGGLVVKLRCRTVYPEESVQAALAKTARYLISELAIPESAILAFVDRVKSGTVFTNGKIWQDDSLQDLSIRPIGIVRNDRSETADDYWGDVSSTIELDQTRFDESCLLGLSEFSHLECIFFFHKVSAEKIVAGSRHPRNLLHLPKVGIFAQRPKSRPNRIGLSVCEIVNVSGTKILVRGLDAIDGTPVLDIKPFFREFAPRGSVRQPDWVLEVMKSYYLEKGH